MRLSRSAFYEAAAARERRQAADAALLEQIEQIAGEQPAYGYRRITQELRRRGTVANHKRVARLMQLGQVTPTRVRRYFATTRSDDSSPVFPDIARHMTPNGR